MNRPDEQRAQARANLGAAGAKAAPKRAAQSEQQARVYRGNASAGPTRARPNSYATVQLPIEPARGRASQRRLIMILAGLSLLLAAGGAAVWAYRTQVEPTVKTLMDVGQGVFVTPPPVRPNPTAGGTPVPVVVPNWDKKEPLNILLIGLDYRPNIEDTRADTQIIVHIDPVAKSAAMVSIPRDLLVTIPNYGEDRINTSYKHGERDKESVPGGGPGLAMATIEYNFDIKIDYYATVNFTGFERIVDAMGGITIDVPKPLVDNEYPTAYDGVTRLYVPAGLQHMDGPTALRYARSRHSDSDFARNDRQQQVLLAIRQRGLSFDLLPRINDLAREVSGTLETSLSPIQVLSLAQLAREIDSSSIQTVLIGPDMISEYTVRETGADVLLPRWELIRPAIARAFADPRLAKEGARLAVYNGTLTGGIGRKVQGVLAGEGLSVNILDSVPDQGDYPTTVVTDFTGGAKPNTINKITELLGTDPKNVVQGDPADAPEASDGEPVDIMVVAGDDWINKEPPGAESTPEP